MAQTMVTAGTVPQSSACLYGSTSRTRSWRHSATWQSAAGGCGARALESRRAACNAAGQVAAASTAWSLQHTAATEGLQHLDRRRTAAQVAGLQAATRLRAAALGSPSSSQAAPSSRLRRRRYRHLARIEAGPVAYASAQTGSLDSALDTQEFCGERHAPRISTEVRDGFWEWKPRWRVHYQVAGEANDRGGPPLLFLPGFGVGAFHFRRQLEELSRERAVWAVDFMGQGQSWPTHDPAPLSEVTEAKSGGDEVLPSDVNPWDWGFGPRAEPWAAGLVYSIDLWREQVEAFISEVIKEPVVLAGNSLGGYVAIAVAANSPQWVRGLVLLNPTPFWAFTPNAKSAPRLARLMPWVGGLPVPRLARSIARGWWDRLRSPVSIRLLLSLVYANRKAIDDALVDDIVAPTRHPAAAAAFASIVFAPKAELTFDQNATRVRECGLPVAMIYGRDDPWVVPLWGQRLKRALPDAVYYELSPVGHCPHHEEPEEKVQRVREGHWIQGRGFMDSASVTKAELAELKAQGCKVVALRLKSGAPTTPVEFLDAAMSTVAATWKRVRAVRSPGSRQQGNAGAGVTAATVLAASGVLEAAQQEDEAQEGAREQQSS